jgi:hypothetical protein
VDGDVSDEPTLSVFKAMFPLINKVYFIMG